MRARSIVIRFGPVHTSGEVAWCRLERAVKVGDGAALEIQSRRDGCGPVIARRHLLKVIRMGCIFQIAHFTRDIVFSTILGMDVADFE